MACRGLFVTGTDTDVGKTYVSRIILEQLSAGGHLVGAYKPVCSGAETNAAGQKVWNDVSKLHAGLNGRFPLERICPQSFEAPLAPPRAAALENDHVDEALVEAGLAWWRDQVEWLLIEGVGGLLAPLTDQQDVAQFAAACGYPLLIVARLGLGTINHTRLTILAARERQLPIAGVILSQSISSADDPSERYNLTDLMARTDVPILGIIGHGQTCVVNAENQKVDPDWLSRFDIARPSR